MVHLYISFLHTGWLNILTTPDSVHSPKEDIGNLPHDIGKISDFRFLKISGPLIGRGPESKPVFFSKIMICLRSLQNNLVVVKNIRSNCKIFEQVVSLQKIQI